MVVPVARLVVELAALPPALGGDGGAGFDLGFAA